MTNFPCIAQADIDQRSQLLSDPQVYAAAVASRPRSTASSADAEAKYDVGIVNESFGAASRQTLEMLQLQYCHDAVDLVGLLRAARQADQRPQRRPSPVRRSSPCGAGGTTASRSTPAPTRSPATSAIPRLCWSAPTTPGRWPGTPSRTTAPASTSTRPGRRSSSSTPGAGCSGPDGTSFAAPLTVRYASMASVPSPFDPRPGPDARCWRPIRPEPVPAGQPVPQRLLLHAGPVTTDFVVPAGRRAGAAAGPRRAADAVRAAPGPGPDRPAQAPARHG